MLVLANLMDGKRNAFEVLGVMWGSVVWQAAHTPSLDGRVLRTQTLGEQSDQGGVTLNVIRSGAVHEGVDLRRTRDGRPQRSQISDMKGPLANKTFEFKSAIGGEDRYAHHTQLPEEQADATEENESK